MTNLSHEDALQALASYYKRRAGELEEGLVISNALVEKLRKTIENSQQDVDEETSN